MSNRIISEIKEETLLFTSKGNRAPSLAVILVGDNPASRSYVKSKTLRCEELGFMHFQYSLSEDCLESDLLSLIEKLNCDDNVDGILVQLPLPSHINKDKVICAIAKEKDVDGFTPYSMGMLTYSRPSFIPCTPKGIIEILKNWNIETRGKEVCIIGRSNIVGKPLSILLSSSPYDATVTLCNSHTKDLKNITSRSDIVIVAVGKSKFIDSSFFKDGTVIIDVGINRVEDNTKPRGYRITGDVDFDSLKERDVMITPVPGGVGLLTVTELMRNTLIAAKTRSKR